MRSYFLVSLGAFALFAATFASADVPANRRPDLNAFVNRKVTTTSSLVNHVRNDPAVADRYERHFSMSRQELVRYLGSLHPTKLGKEGVYTVYSVPEGGRVKMHLERLKKGTPIFADESGKPTLVVKCGNPLVLRSHFRSNSIVLTPVGTDKTRVVSMVEPRGTDLSDPDELVALAPEVPDPILGGESTPTAGPIGNVGTITSVPLAGGGGNRFPYAALLPLGLLGFIHHGGGDGGGITPVPEPATMVMMGLGVAGIAARRRRR